MQAASTERVCTYRGRSWSSFVLLEAKKSAEVIVGKQTLKQCLAELLGAEQERLSPKDWILNVGRIIMPTQCKALTSNGAPQRVMLVRKTTNLNWCKEQMRSCLGNRRVRDPYARWCERRTPLKVYFGRSRLLDSLLCSFFKFISIEGLNYLF